MSITQAHECRLGFANWLGIVCSLPREGMKMKVSLVKVASFQAAFTTPLDSQVAKWERCLNE